MALTGPFGAVLENTKTALGTSSSWQTWTVTDNVTDAKAHVIINRELGSARPDPEAFVWFTAGTKQKRGAQGYNLWLDGAVILRFAASTPEAYLDDPNARDEWFMQAVFDVIADLTTLCSQPGYPAFKAFTPQEGPGVLEDEHTGEGTEIMAWEWHLEMSSGS